MRSQKFHTTPRKNIARSHGPKNASQQKGGKATVREQALISKIIQQFTSRSRVDIDKWRKAIAEAENDRYPKRDLWGQLIKDLDLDAHWSSQVLVRKLSVMRKPFKIVDKNSRKEIPEKTKMFQAPWFYYLMNTALDAKFFGTQVIEIEDLITGNQKQDAVYKIPVRHIVPEKKTVLFKSSSNSGYYYGEDPYVIEFCEGDFMGLLCKAAPHIIWKRNALQSWAEFCEKFGIPMRFATTNKKDQGTLDKLEKMLDQLGSAARAIFPEGTVIDFKEANTRDAFEVFDKMIERANSEISKLVNAVTMISDNGSSLSQSKVHQDINAKIIDSDAADFAGVMNWTVGPQLAALGYGFNPATQEWIWDDTEAMSLGSLWNITQGVLKFFEVDETWLTEKFGIPITGKRATPIQESGSTSGNIPNNVFNGDPIEVWLRNELVKMIREATVNFNVDHLNPATAGPFDHAGYSNVLGSSPKRWSAPRMAMLDNLFLKAAKWFFEKQSNKPSALQQEEWNDLYTHVSKTMYGGIEEGFGKSLDTPDLETADEALLKKMRENMYVFSAFKNYQLLQSLNANLIGEDGKVREWSDFKQLALQQKEDYLVSWLQTEYNTAVGRAQFQARYAEWIAEAGDYDLEFQTVGDERVRDTHDALNGIVAKATDDIVLRLATPIDWNCRCEWVQIPAGSRTITDTSTITIPERSKGLSSKAGEVFNAAHPYYQGISIDDKKAIKKIADDELKKLD
jgi:SPP1 gp7 family putative phage head morphogenesis protein